MDYPGKNIIDSLDQAIADSAAAFETGLPAVSSEVSEAVAEFLAMLAKNRNAVSTTGTIKASVANLKAIVKFKSHLAKVFHSGEYSLLTQGYQHAFREVTWLTNQYFSLISEGFQVTDFYNAIRNDTINTTLDFLLESGMEANFIQPIQKILTQSVTGQMSSKQALQTVKEMLSEAGQPTKWAKQFTDDALNQYARTYTQAISDDLGLDHYLYSGTQITSTRPFCQSKVGKVFTKAEVLSWAKQDWSGKNPATNTGNIQLLLGGFKCRHRLVPITAVAYRELKG